MSSGLLPAFLESERALRRVLSREKQRRGRPKDELLYVGVHNLAQFWWCAMFAVFKSRAMEWRFLRSALLDTWAYAHALGLVTVPRSAAQLINLRRKLPRERVEKLGLSPVGPPSLATAIVPGLDLREFFDEDCDDHSDPSSEHAEKYPKYRWNFEYSGYVLVGVPDGLTRDFVYEFKSTSSGSLFRRVARPVGRTQADIYGILYRRSSKRLQVYVREDDELHTLDEPVDRERVVETMQKFRRADRTGKARPPQSWKCRRCEFAASCTVRLATI